VKIGDKIIGIDGYDVRDEGLPQHLMEIMPGNTVTVSVLRNGERNDLHITAMTN
jgi:C-terminal processing protease CtpA/Prc